VNEINHLENPFIIKQKNMNCCNNKAIEKQFDKDRVTNRVNQYHSKGISKETRILIDSLKSMGIEGYSLLDIGCGFGAIGIELLEAGVAKVENQEASSSYLEAKRIVNPVAYK